MVLARVGAGSEVLAPVLDIAEWLLVGLGEPRDAQLFLLEHALVAEGASHVGRDDSHLGLLQPQALGEDAAYHVWHLGGANHDQLVGAMVPVGQHRLAFHGHHALARQVDPAVHDEVGPGGVFLEIPVRLQCDEYVVAPVLMDEISRGALGAVGVGVDWQFVVIDLDQFSDVFRLGPSRGERHGNGFADEADLAARQRGLRGWLVRGQRGVRRDVRGIGHHVAQHHAIPRRFGHAHVGDARVRDRTAEKCDFSQARHGHVGDEVTLAVQVPRVFLARHPRPHALAGGRGRARVLCHLLAPTLGSVTSNCA